MRAAVVIAYKDRGDPYRRASFEWTTRYWAALGYPIYVSCPDPFTRPSAINRAVERADADVILQADPDSFLLLKRAEEALRLAAAAPGLVVPFHEYRYLTAAFSESMMADPAALLTSGDAVCEERGPGGVGNVVAFSRETWEAAGRFDERFRWNWGGDDGAFAYAAEALVAPIRRLDGPVYHLWHPRQPESQPGHPVYQEQFALLAAYRDAAGDPDAIRVILEARS